MLIILLLYILLIWLILFQFKWLRFNWLFRSLAVLVGAAIMAVFVGLLSYLTPSGKIEVIGRVTEVTPNVSGRVTAILVGLNVPAKAGTVLFQIDRAPFEYRVRQLKAALVEAQHKVGELKADVGAASLVRVSSIGVTTNYAVGISVPEGIFRLHRCGLA